MTVFASSSQSKSRCLCFCSVRVNWITGLRIRIYFLVWLCRVCGLSRGSSLAYRVNICVMEINCLNTYITNYTYKSGQTCCVCEVSFFFFLLWKLIPQRIRSLTSRNHTRSYKHSLLFEDFPHHGHDPGTVMEFSINRDWRGQIATTLPLLVKPISRSMTTHGSLREKEFLNNFVHRPHSPSSVIIIVS